MHTKLIATLAALAFTFTAGAASAADQDGKLNGITNQSGWTAIKGVHVEAMNADEMAAVVGASIGIIFPDGFAAVHPDRWI